MKKNNGLNILLMTVGIIVGAYKYIEGGFHWYIKANIENIIMTGDMIYFLIVSILAGMCNGFGKKIAKAARHDETECKVLIKSGFWVVVLLSISMIIVCELCQDAIIYWVAPSPEVHSYINFYFGMYMKGLLFTMLFSYILVIIRVLGDYKIPCLFIIGAVFAEWGMIKILMNIPSFPGRYLPNVANVKVLLNIFICFIAYVYFRMKYSVWCRAKINMKMFIKTLVQFFKAGSAMELLGLPLVFMILIEINNFINVDFLEPVTYYGNLLLLGAVVMAPFMARLLVERYSED